MLYILRYKSIIPKPMVFPMAFRDFPRFGCPSAGQRLHAAVPGHTGPGHAAPPGAHPGDGDGGGHGVAGDAGGDDASSLAVV